MFWDKVSGLYDLFENIYNKSVYRSTGETVAKYIKETDKVLECACGTGAISIYIAPVCSKLFASDYSTGMLKQAEKKLKVFNNVELGKVDITDIEAKDDSFDVVVAGNVIHLLPDPQKAMKELARVCKDGGKVIIPTYINGDEGTNKLAVKFLEKLGAGFKRQFDADSYEKFFKEMGYEAAYEIVRGRMSCDIAVIEIRKRKKCDSFYESVTERLIRYAKIDTQSMANTDRIPSTEKQFDLARVLRDELVQCGVSNVWLDEKNCVVYGEVPSNLPKGEGRAVGYITHMDTSPDAPSENVKPWLLKNYDGNDIILNKEKDIVLKVSDYPFITGYVGQDLVLTDGTTLLGGDDKAAIASVMTFCEYMVSHPEIKHGPIKVAFTPDEEVGGLAENLNIGRFGAEVAYTLDGDHAGFYSYETFNAIEAQINITGLNVHPGTAKGIMVNAIEIGTKFIEMLPEFEKPQYTEGREGFYHPHGFFGNVEKAQVLCLIRDHDENHFEERKEYIRKCVDELNALYGGNRVELVFANGYSSMKKAVEKVPFMIENLTRAISECGLTPTELAFRGGTDGSAISQRGLPCPNLSAGYENGHSRFEFVSVQTMCKNVEILIKLSEIYAGE